MKYAHFTQKLWQGFTAKPLSTPEWKETCQRVLVRDGLHCRICGTAGKLVCHSRTNEYEGYELSDVIALCEDCYKLAQARKRKRMQSMVIHSLQYACFITLLLGTMISIVVLALHSPFFLALLFLACIYAVLLLETLSNRWL